MKKEKRERWQERLGQAASSRENRVFAYLSVCSDTEYLNLLTAGINFIIRTALNAIPEPNLTSDKIVLAEKWKMTQKSSKFSGKVSIGFVSMDQLSQLQGQIKWLRNKPNLMINDLILLKEGNLSE
ncbi:hypothetical protein CEXT_282951 [Caerostris extrusa]|uniref:Uncharacterized protein n=1 Tax=Caerostris extrusa TaxID=172846 RepID=A0AAV4W438_CAEEX|nr:hypothetical protein CEXT_282951 [Caerostris extrusa]